MDALQPRGQGILEEPRRMYVLSLFFQFLNHYQNLLIVLAGNCHTSSLFRTRKYSIEMGSSSTKIRNGETENYSISRNCNDYEMNKQNVIDSVLFKSTIGAEFFYRFIHSYIHTYLPT